MAGGDKIKIWIELKVSVLVSESEIKDKTLEMKELNSKALDAFAGNVVETSITMKEHQG